MMFPSHRPSDSPAPAVASKPSSVILSVDDDSDSQPHTDYDLHPLLVNGLDHYAVLNDQKERFSVR